MGYVVRTDGSSSVRSGHGRTPGLHVEELAAALDRSESKVLDVAPDGGYVEHRYAPGAHAAAVGTRCFIEVDQSWPDLASVLAPSGIDGADIDRVNLYLSPPGTGSPLHFDDRQVLIVQLAGTKLWQVAAEPSIAEPKHNVVADEVRAVGEHLGTPVSVPDRMHFCRLRAGDWLLIPRGTWHGTFSASGSLSATLAFRADAPAASSTIDGAIPPIGERVRCW